MRIRSESWQRRRDERQTRREAKRRHRREKEMARQTELRHRDEHTGGYGDPPYSP
jgi:hypothetical protein